MKHEVSYTYTYSFKGIPSAVQISPLFIYHLYYFILYDVVSQKQVHHQDTYDIDI